MSRSPSYPARSRPAHIAAWVLQILLALAFAGAAGAKLFGVPMMVQEFDTIGLGQGFRYVTGLVEIVGVVALIAPRLTAFGGLWLGATMVGAVIAHLGPLNSSPVGAVVLLVLCLTLAWLRRDQLFAFLGARA